jgi:CheY-like chemotaxis protein
MKKRVLVVDDEPHIREVAAASLEMVGGYEVVTADSGARAIEIAGRDRPDLILLDVMMPGMDGTAAFERLREDAATAAIPVVFLTAKVQAADQRRFKELGATGVIAKPFDPLALSQEVARALGETR